MPIFQGEAFLERVLTSLAKQDLELPWEFHAADCGSTDRTLAIFKDFQERFPVPLTVHSILGAEFNHGDTRNLLASWNQADLCVFLTDDAIPCEADWLRQLVANFDDPLVGAAYCRNVPRPEADALAQSLSLPDPSYALERQVAQWPEPQVFERMSAAEKRVLYNYTDTASAVRRILWERHPYPRCSFGEDVLLKRVLLQAGYHVAFCDRAKVYHSHEYGLQETEQRAVPDARFNAEWLNRIAVPSPRMVPWLVERQLALDSEHLQAKLSGFAEQPERSVAQLEQELARAKPLREAYYRGLCRGGRSLRRRTATRFPDERDRTHVLIAGEAQAWTLQLAKDFQQFEPVNPNGRIQVHWLKASNDQAQQADLDSRTPTVLCLEPEQPLAQWRAWHRAKLPVIAWISSEDVLRKPRYRSVLSRCGSLVFATVELRQFAVQKCGMDADRCVFLTLPTHTGPTGQAVAELPYPELPRARERTWSDWVGAWRFLLAQSRCWSHDAQESARGRLHQAWVAEAQTPGGASPQLANWFAHDCVELSAGARLSFEWPSGGEGHAQFAANLLVLHTRASSSQPTNSGRLRLPGGSWQAFGPCHWIEAALGETDEPSDWRSWVLPLKPESATEPPGCLEIEAGSSGLALAGFELWNTQERNAHLESGQWLWESPERHDLRSGQPLQMQLHGVGPGPIELALSLKLPKLLKVSQPSCLNVLLNNRPVGR